MSKTKLMKLRPSRSRICCRDRGKVSRKTDVRKGAPYDKAASRSRASPLTVFRKPTLNPPKEAMVPLTREDFEKVNYVHNTEPEYELAKYHAELIHNDVQVTMHMLRTEWLEIHKRLGIQVTDHQRSSHRMIALLIRLRLLRFAKCQGYDTSKKSMNIVRPLLREIVSQEEPMDAHSLHKMVHAHCTCTPEAKVLSDKFLQEDKSHDTAQQSESSATHSSTDTPDLNNLFSTPSLPDLFSVPSTSSSNHIYEPFEEVSTTSSRSNKEYFKSIRKLLCAFCRQKVGRKYFSKSKFETHKFVGYDYSFPELLPECPVAMKQPEHEMVIASEPETILESDNDDVYAALFYISQNQKWLI